MKKLTAKVLAPAIALLLGTPAFAADPTGRVDINTATAEELKTTLGVDDAEAQRIIDARPYYKKEELKTRQVMTADEFEKLQKLVESVC